MQSAVIKNVSGKTVTVYQDAGVSPSAPVVYLTLYSGRGREVWNACHALVCPPFTLAAVGDIAWDDEMTPWPHGPVFRGDAGYKGNAPDFLQLLTDTVVPYVESMTGGKPEYSVLAGYSLGGLFAFWTAFRETVFTRFVSASGSLWYPDFMQYTAKTEFRQKPDFVYLSLGDREEKVKNTVLAAVGDCTRHAYTLLNERGIPSVLEMNEGNHFVDADIRTAKGIKAALGFSN